jgi:hypothetical protein
VWWQCKDDPDHEWQARLDRQTRRLNRGFVCPYCRHGPSLRAIRGLLAARGVHVDSISTAELYWLAHTQGLLRSPAQRRALSGTIIAPGHVGSAPAETPSGADSAERIVPRRKPSSKKTQQREDDLRDLALAAARLLTDDRERVSLDTLLG